MFFNKIYYAFSKTETWINLTKRKGDLSWLSLLDTLVGFEMGISLAVASLPTFLFIKNYFDYIVAIPFAIAFIIHFLINRYVKKMELEKPDKKLWQQFDESVIIPEWIAIGIITMISSYICAIGGGMLFFLSILHIYE
ncbi:MAG: hypothetical protein IJ647_05510 [Prevotella sp.]|nr:hypothetical protein [Prevotella sp.]